MVELRFDEQLCQRCETVDCLVRCQYLHLDLLQAREEMARIIRGEHSMVLDQCVTCYACEEYCPYGNHPFYLIVERQESEGMLLAPRPVTTQWINLCEPVGKFKTGKLKKRALSLCFIPAFEDLLDGQLFEDVRSSYFIGPEFFCNVVYMHFAKASVMKDRLPRVVENIARLGVSEVICLHDECYGSYKSLAPAYGIDVPFRVTHYFEYLLARLRQLEAKVRPLNVKVAYQRNCSSRLVPETDHLVDEIFGLLGAERIERQYDRENALCCSELIRMTKGMEGYDIADDNQEKNVADMVGAGAEYCVFNCPYCHMALAEKVFKSGVKPIHMIDLCKLGLGEEPSKGVIGYGRYS